MPSGDPGISNRESGRLKVGIVGATGMVGRRMASLLVNHPSFELTMLVGSEKRVGLPYGAIWQEKESALRDHYGSFWRSYHCPEILQGVRLASFEELEASACSVIFSSIHQREGHLEDRLIRPGRVVFSNSPHRRFDPAVNLMVPEVNGMSICDTPLVKYPNCVTSGLALVLAPLHEKYGLREVVVTTYQSISGRGDSKYDLELVIDNVYPLHSSGEATEDFILREIKKLFGTSFRTSVTCNRVCVQEGHLVEVRVRTRSAIEDADEIRAVLSSFNPLANSNLHSNPARPITVVGEPGRPRPREDSSHVNGMSVAVGNISTNDEIFDLRLSFVVNNLVRGAAGGIILCAEICEARGGSGHIETPCAKMASGEDVID